ncbi:hypothetical protein EXN66_Car013867 [Channa argus]|uniref:Uncharacterized protein n=1 Tax=Channa argus TaxID=215402 RepID=A0A6G1Q7Q1_CHAAH|nr:hypothetical protein EXN66_Car013867 [Channa argus]
MERVSLQYISPTDSMDSEDSKLSKAEILRGLITEKLTTAAQEIFAVVERTVAGYEEEVSGLKQEVDRQKKQMEVVLQPHVSLCRIDVDNDNLQREIRTALPELHEETARTLSEHLRENIGVRTTQDLFFVEPGDVCTFLTPIQCRRLIQAFKKGRMLLKVKLGDVQKFVRVSKPSLKQFLIDETAATEVSSEWSQLSLSSLHSSDSQDTVLISDGPSTKRQKLDTEAKQKMPVGLSQAIERGVMAPPEDRRKMIRIVVEAMRVHCLNPNLAACTEVSRFFVRINPDVGTKCTAKLGTSRKTGRVVSRKAANVNVMPHSSNALLNLNAGHPDRDQSVTPEIRMWNPLNLRVCLLRDTQANMVKESDVKQAAGSKEVSGHTEEQEEEKEEVASAEEPAQSTSVEQEGLRDPDYQIPKKRGQSVKTKFRTCDRFILRVCLLRNNQTNVLKKGVLKSQIKRMKCPRCMKEADFLTQLRSTFPKLNGEFDTFTSDATRKLTPLKLNTLTPVEIYNSIKSSGKGRSALYIRVKAADEKQISDKELHPAITGSLSTSVAASDETGQHKSICSRALERVEGKKADAVSSNPRKHQIETKDADDDHGVDLPVLPDPTSDSLVASPTHSAALSEANHGEAPENRQQDDSDWCMMESNTDSYSLVRHRKQSSRLSSLPSSASSEPNNEENASDSNMNEDHRDTDWKPEKGDESPSSKMKTKKQKSLQVRVCFLKDTQTDMLTKKAYKCPVRMLMCPRGLQQKEFLALLRSTFPEILKGNQPFDAFLTDNLRRLEPLKVKTLTAEEICKSIRSNGKGRSALCIRVKRNNEATSETPCTSTTPNYENMPHASSSNSPVEKAKQQQIKTDEVEEGEDCGISDSDDITVLSSAGYATENEDNSGGDEEVEEGESDVDWQSDKNDDEQQGESDPKLKSLKVKKSSYVDTIRVKAI